MPASALLGNELRFQYLDTDASPNSYKVMNAALDFGEFGEEKPIVDITVLASSAREYRNGLRDGLEIPLQMNFNENDSEWEFMYNLYSTDTLGSFRIIVPTASPEFGFGFQATVRGWRISGTPGEKSTATFTLKISGAVSLI